MPSNFGRASDEDNGAISLLGRLYGANCTIIGGSTARWLLPDAAFAPLPTAGAGSLRRGHNAARRWAIAAVGRNRRRAAENAAGVGDVRDAVPLPLGICCGRRVLLMGVAGVVAKGSGKARRRHVTAVPLQWRLPQRNSVAADGRAAARNNAAAGAGCFADSGRQKLPLLLFAGRKQRAAAILAVAATANTGAAAFTRRCKKRSGVVSITITRGYCAVH